MTSREVESEILTQLKLRFANENEPGVAKRRVRLRQLFSSIPDHASATALYSRLVVALSGDELSRAFHERLHTVTRHELINILHQKVKTPPAYKVAPKTAGPVPKKPNLNGQKYAESLPVHPRAWNDIAMEQLVSEDLPDGYIITDSTYDEVFDDDVPLVGKIKLKYKFVPVVDDIDGVPHILYYTAYNVKAKRVEYAVGPALLPEFRKLLPGPFGLAGIASWYFAFGGHYREYQRQLGRAVHYSQRGEWLRTGDSLGKVYSKAAKDPRYWFDMVLSTLGAYAFAGKPTTPGVPLRGNSNVPNAALQQLEKTSVAAVDAGVQRSSTVLTEARTFRHIIRDDPLLAYGSIESQASMRLSTGGRAVYGEGVYAWPSQGQTSYIYIDIQVPAGVAVETIIHPSHGTFYRMITASGNTVPVRIVNTNLSPEEILMAREFAKIK